MRYMVNRVIIVHLTQEGTTRVPNTDIRAVGTSSLLVTMEGNWLAINGNMTTNGNPISVQNIAFPATGIKHVELVQ